MKNPHRFTLRAGAFMHRNRILLAALFAAFIVSILAITPRDGATAKSASAAAAVTAIPAANDPCFTVGSIRLQNGTATFSSTRFEITSPAQAVDGNFDSSNGWHIARVDAFDGTTSETAVWETATDVSAGPLVFKMYFLHDNPGHLLGRFRFSVTTDDRSTFAGGLDTGGDVDANWIVLTNPTVIGPAGMTFTTLPDNSVLAGGTTAAQGTYTVSYSTMISGITGMRLEALEDPSLPGGNGPGLFPRNGNFFLTELQVNPIDSAVFNIADGDVAGLIAAINSANASGCPATINLAPNGTYTLTAGADNGDPDFYQASGAAGLPYIRTPITINGNGATIQRSAATGTPDFVVLAVSGAGPYKGNLTLNGVTLIGGSLGGLNLAYGTALVQNSTVTRNTGGGINNICGSLTMVNSTVSYNTSDSAWGGGGIFLWGFACAPGYPVANISSSTIFENSNPGWGRGNAIGTAYVGSPGGVFLKNSILASPSHPSEAVCNNGAGTLYSLGHNILGDAADVFGSRCASALTAPGDMVNTNPLLGPLANNGGLTPTHLPLCNSPAIDAVPVADSTDVNGVAITSDQRGVSRPIGAACDIGSVEAATTVTVTIPSTAGPWSPGLNSAFDYGVHDNTSPVVIDASSGFALTPGSTLAVTYLSGAVVAGAGYPPNDANGEPGNVTNSCTSNCFPAVHMNPGPDVLSMELVGTFANNGVIVGRPFPIGNGPTVCTIPTGANQLLLGINDNRYGDNSGSFTVAVSGVPANTPPIVSCPSPTTAAADSNCQARVPNILAGVTASGGCGGPVTLSQSPAAGTFVGLGATTITVTATDAAHNSSTCTTTFTVLDNTPPNITAPADVSVVDNAAGSCGALVNPGTPVISDNCGTASVVGIRSDGKALTALYPVGATVITWTVTDTSGNTASAQQNVVVTNPAPQVTIIGPSSGALYVVNTAVNFTGSFSDNAGDSHTAVWTFDGTPQAGIVNETTHTVSASHTFDSAGVYLVALTITDDCGQTVATNQVGGFDALVVVYDPNAGFVTGGGWINSPAGSYAPNPNLVGQANFGFVSKYQKGANVPDGQTEFQFKVANLNFHSTVYEWLVVAGAKAQYKGSGTINGRGNYGFMLTAIDGDINGGGGIDKFRIKIWDKNNGDAVVYDNQMGAGIDDNPTTALAGGSIVIHK